MPKQFNFTFTKDFEDFKILFEIENFYPGRSAPPCSDPDSPAFSDTGDDVEIGTVEVFYITEDFPEEKIMFPIGIAESLTRIFCEEIIDHGIGIYEKREGCDEP